VCLVQQRVRSSVTLIVFALLCAAAASVSFGPASRAVTEDRNGDGRPDVWRTYDRQGRLSEVAIDTNFDGRSDVHEYYDAGTLVSRESDRNFDDRVDLVQQFDYTTHDQLRAVEDVDYDGRADVLVLFQGGRPVYSRWARHAPLAVALTTTAPSPASARRADDDPLTRFDDPFENDLAMRAVRVAAAVDDCVGSSTSGRLATTGLEVGDRLASPSALKPDGCRALPSVNLDPHAPRGPPFTRS
jgi:hypothetical protein